MNGSNWTIESWVSKPAQQQPQYDPPALELVLERVKSYPPLVFAGEVDRLKTHLARASRGEAFVLQGGDCAERFMDCRPEVIANKLKILLQMSVVLCYGLRRPVVRIGRIAGQYAKPRSSDFEEIDGKKFPSYRGDSVNAFEPSERGRQPDTQRLLRAYHYSAMTLNYVRAMISGGFADLHHPEKWNLGFVKKSQNRSRYEEVVENIQDAIAFMGSLGSLREDAMGSVEFYTSHEGLILPYESALTRFDPGRERHYNLGAHMLWVGDRTRQLDGAHIELFRGVANPIGVKVGPSSDPKEVCALVERLNPDNESGKVVIITRFGHGKVASGLPPLVEAVEEAQRDVLWIVDPMHGNAIKSRDSIKTRNFDHILSELAASVEVHRSLGTILGGVHFELTGEDVTECIGGSEKVQEEDLSQNYESFCDPRLNDSQSLEMAFEISRLL